MSKKYQSFPGMDDILPGEVEKWQWIEARARDFFQSRGYKEIRTPILEPTELFLRSIGETTDIVHKEMYSFEDRGERKMTMRPEMTASVARSVVQNSLVRGSNVLKLYYIGAMFRAEKPQAGRKRQFHQIGAELINLSGADADLAIILNLYRFIQYLKIEEPILKINDLSVINGPDAEKIRKKIRDYFESHKASLDKDSLYRLDKNVLRIFDSKDAKTQKVISEMPWSDLVPVSDEFKRLKEKLDEQGVKYLEDPKLVRGLDYYTGVVFEVSLPGLGAQDAVAGGGRYDRLYSEIGGPDIPCTGFSIGMERLIMALEKNKPSIDEQIREKVIYVAPLVKREDDACIPISHEVFDAVIELYSHGVNAVTGEETHKLAKHLSRADSLGADVVLINGIDEHADKTWTVKMMKDGQEEKVKKNDLVRFLLKKLRGVEVL